MGDVVGALGSEVCCYVRVCRSGGGREVELVVVVVGAQTGDMYKNGDVVAERLA